MPYYMDYTPSYHRLLSNEWQRLFQAVETHPLEKATPQQMISNRVLLPLLKTYHESSVCSAHTRLGPRVNGQIYTWGDNGEWEAARPVSKNLRYGFCLRTSSSTHVICVHLASKMRRTCSNFAFAKISSRLLASNNERGSRISACKHVSPDTGTFQTSLLETWTGACQHVSKGAPSCRRG